jgi:hypothetical protein
MPVPADPSGIDTMMSELGMPAESDAHALRPKARASGQNRTASEQCNGAKPALTFVQRALDLGHERPSD